MNKELTLLISYRNRREHAETFLEWFCRLENKNIEAIFIEQDAAPTIRELIESIPGCRYIFIPNAGPFHISKGLNMGLALSEGSLVAPYDIDLIPLRDTLPKQLRFALTHPQIIFSGYRLMSMQRKISPENIAAAVLASEVSISEHPFYLMQRLVEKQKYGVIPFLSRKRLVEIGGWDERFVGWGAEDQEILDRYVTDEMLFMRSEEFVYLHQHHGFEANWREEEFTRKNRELFYAGRK